MVELTDGLDKIKKLKPYSFTWKKGFDENLAKELEENALKDKYFIEQGNEPWKA